MLATAVTLAAVLACATSVFSYLASVSAGSPDCSGRDLIEGYRNGTSDFWALPLFSILAAAVVEKTRKDPKTIALLQRLDVLVFELGLLRVTYGMFLVYAVLFRFVAISASMTHFSIKRYSAISTYCQRA
jgi:hypothetical protein